LFEIAISSVEIGGLLCSALLGSADCAEWLYRIYSAPLIDAGSALAPGLIVATDTTFSSTRFAWTHQVHKSN
jgi:hypothetical protein